jgi:putative phage-type endonuclease
MKIDLKQNSWEWFQHRKNFINASEIGTIMGLNPYETQEDLIKKKLFGSNFITNDAVEHGKKTEPKANLFFSIKTKRNYESAVFTNGIFSASLDGFHELSKTMLEIKCPLNKNGLSWKSFFNEGIIPPYYWAQIQCGLYCAEINKAYFLVYINDEDYTIKEVFLDQKFIDEMLIICPKYKEKLKKYQEQLNNND